MTRSLVPWLLLVSAVLVEAAGQVANPAPAPSGLTQITLALIAGLPAILTALAATIGAFLAYRNGRKTDKVDVKVDAVAEKTDVAASKADAAATKADETHVATQAIATKSDQIAANTDGHLSRLTEQVTDLQARNAELTKTVSTFASILTAGRVAEASASGKDSVTVPAVRPEDISQAIETLQQIKPAQNGVAPEADQRKKEAGPS